MRYINKNLEGKAAKTVPAWDSSINPPSADLINKYACGNMYVDYPHKSKWRNDFSIEDYSEALNTMCSDKVVPPTMLYVHIPFCAELCYFCLCHKTITRDEDKINRYMRYLYREIDILKARFQENGLTPNFKEIHLGGGSPTILEKPEFDKFFDKLGEILNINSLFELTLEVDPRIVTEDMLHYYHDKGVTRLSFGIQDFDTDVGKAVNRVNPPDMLEKLLTPSIRKKFPSINFDILVGLPLQTLESFKWTIDHVIRFAPSRIDLAFVNYTTKSQKGQKLIKKSDCPEDVDTHKMFFQAKRKMLDNGYHCIGFDHFALPGDKIVDHLNNKTLRWNTLGYAPGKIVNMVGIGVHSASRISNYFYVQNQYGYEEYEAAIDAGCLPIFRGLKLTKDDVLRREVIEKIRCYTKIHKSEFEASYGIDFDKYFKDELDLMQEFVEDQIVAITGDKIEVTPMGTMFINNVCRIWDAYSPIPLNRSEFFQKISKTDVRKA